MADYKTRITKAVLDYMDRYLDEKYDRIERGEYSKFFDDRTREAVLNEAILNTLDVDSPEVRMQVESLLNSKDFTREQSLRHSNPEALAAYKKAREGVFLSDELPKDARNEVNWIVQSKYNTLRNLAEYRLHPDNFNSLLKSKPKPFDQKYYDKWYNDVENDMAKRFGGGDEFRARMKSYLERRESAKKYDYAQSNPEYYLNSLKHGDMTPFDPRYPDFKVRETRRWYNFPEVGPIPDLSKLNAPGASFTQSPLLPPPPPPPPPPPEPNHEGLLARAMELNAEPEMLMDGLEEIPEVSDVIEDEPVAPSSVAPDISNIEIPELNEPEPTFEPLPSPEPEQKPRGLLARAIEAREGLIHDAVASRHGLLARAKAVRETFGIKDAPTDEAAPRGLLAKALKIRGETIGEMAAPKPRGLLAKALKIRGETIGEMAAPKPRGLLARAIEARESTLPPDLADDIAVSPEDEQFPYAEEPELEEPFPDDVSEPRNSLFTMLKAGVRRIPSDLKRAALAPGRKFVDGVIKMGETGRSTASRIGEFASARGRAVRDFVKGAPGRARGLLERVQTARRNAGYYYSPENIARRERGEERRARMQGVWRNLRVSAERARLDIAGGAMNARYNAAERIRGLFHRGGGSPADEAPAEEAPAEEAPAEDTPPAPPPAPPAEPELTTNSQKVGEGVAYTLGNGKDYNVPSQNFDKTFAHMQRGIQSSLREGDYIGASNKYSTDGRNFERTLFTRRSADRRAESAIETALSLMNGAADEEGNIDPEREVSFQKEGTSIYRGKENFYGRAAKDELKRSLAKNGGRIVGVNGDEVEYEYAMLNSTSDSYAAEGKSAPAEFEARAFKRARELSGAQKQKDDEKQQKQKEAEDKKAEDKKSAERAASQKAAGKAILAAIVLVANLVRRILTSMLKDMEQRRQDGLDGRKLGETARDVRDYRNSERTMGVREGTVMAAIQSIQDNFGDVRHYNTQKFEEVAPWAEDVLRPLIDTGVTHREPRVALAAVLDRAMERVKSGVDSTGNRVGEEAAYRSIMGSLERFDPNAAALFQNMYDTNTYGIYEGRANTFEEWLKVGGVSTAATSAEVGYYEELTQTTQGLIAAFNRLKDDAILKLAATLEGLINWAGNLDVGASPEERVDNALKRKQRAEEQVAVYSGMRAQMANTIQGLVESRGLDFSDIGVADAEEFLDRYTNNDKKLFNAMSNSTNEQWTMFSNSAQVRDTAYMYAVTSKNKEKLEKSLKRAEDLHDITKIDYDPNDHTDSSLAVQYAEYAKYGDAFFKGNTAYGFDNASVFLTGNYNTWIKSKDAVELGLYERYGGEINSLDDIIKRGKDHKGAAKKTFSNLQAILNKRAKGLKTDGGKAPKLKFGLSDNLETKAQKIMQFLADTGLRLDEETLLYAASPLVQDITKMGSYLDRDADTTLAIQSANHQYEDTLQQKGYHYNALARSNPQLLKLVQKADEYMKGAGVSPDSYNMQVQSYAKSENEIVFKLKAVGFDGKTYELGEFSTSPNSTGLEEGRVFTHEIDEKTMLENVE